MRTGWVIAAAFVLAGAATAQEAVPSVDELARRNAELEERVQRLEQSALEEDIESYLREAPAEAAQGADGILPGGRALRVSGEIRIRGELPDHIYTPTDSDGTSSLHCAHMRTRLRFDVDVVENVAAVVELQDIRVLGGEGAVVADTEGVDLKRAEMIFKQVLGQPLSVEAGRFVMAYGDHRIVGDLEWFDQGRTYDGIRGQWAEGDWWVDAFWVVVRETAPVDDDLNFAGFYGGWKWLEVYALLLMDHSNLAGEAGTGHTDFVTLGLRVARETGRWKYSTEFAFQVGDLRGDDLSAFAFAVWVAYTLSDTPWQPQLILEFDYASGDDDPTDGDVGQMQTIFPTNHKWYGHADLVGWSNMMDIRFGISAKPSATVTVTFDFHHFMRPEDLGGWVNAGGAVIRPGAAGVSSHLGDEVDLTLTWVPVKQVSFLLGWAVFFPGGFVEDTGASPTAHFAYVQGRVKF